MSGYGKIGNMRVLDIIVIDEKLETDDKSIYKGMVEDAPQNVKEMEYIKIEVGNPTKLYV